MDFPSAVSTDCLLWANAPPKKTTKCKQNTKTNLFEGIRELLSQPKLKRPGSEKESTLRWVQFQKDFPMGTLGVRKWHGAQRLRSQAESSDHGLENLPEPCAVS